MRKRFGWWLRCFADRIDPDHAPRGMGYSFTFEQGRGVVFHENSNTGCQLWYLGHSEFEKAYPLSQRLQGQ